MKTTTTTTFYTALVATVKKLYDNLDAYARLNRSYSATAAGDLIADGTDFGISAAAHPRLLPLFDEVKAITVAVVEAMDETAEATRYYNALALGTEIEDTDPMGDGNTGADLKGAMTSLGAADTFLTAGFHYTNLCQLQHTAKRASATWEAGITGAQLKSALTSLGALVTYLDGNWHWTNLDKLV